MKIDELDVVALTTPLPNAEMYDGSDGLHIGDQVCLVWTNTPTVRHTAIRAENAQR